MKRKVRLKVVYPVENIPYFLLEEMSAGEKGHRWELVKVLRTIYLKWKLLV